MPTNKFRSISLIEDENGALMVEREIYDELYESISRELDEQRTNKVITSIIRDGECLNELAETIAEEDVAAVEIVEKVQYGDIYELNQALNQDYAQRRLI